MHVEYTGSDPVEWSQESQEGFYCWVSFSFNLLVPGVFPLQCMNGPRAFFSLASFFLAYNLQIHITFYILISDTCFMYQTVGNCPTNQVNTITTIVK